MRRRHKKVNVETVLRRAIRPENTEYLLNGSMFLDSNGKSERSKYPHLGDHERSFGARDQGMGGNIICQGRGRLQMAIRIFATCKLASWAMRDYRPPSTLTTQGLVLRCLPGPMRSKNGRVAFDEGMDSRRGNKKRTE